jgi:hypothetical protein
MRLRWGRFLLTWTGHEHPVWRLMRKGKSPRVEIVLYSGLSVLTLIGGVYLFRTRSEFRWLLAIHHIVFPVVYYMGPHYRLPIDPVLIVLAAVALARLAGVLAWQSPGPLPLHIPPGGDLR